MIALEVKLNDSIISIAGEEGSRVIVGDINIFVGKNGSHETTMGVFGGSGDNTLKTWLEFESIHVGDKVTFRVIESNKVNSPIRRDNFKENGS